MKTYLCPVCKKPLTKKEYKRALGILGAREGHLEHEKADLQKALRESKRKERKARQEGMKTERARTKRLLDGKVEEIRSGSNR
jgi:septum formation inhibitor MinC